MPPARTSSSSTSRGKARLHASDNPGNNCSEGPAGLARPWTPAAPRNHGVDTNGLFPCDSGDSKCLVSKPKLRLPALRPITASLFDPRIIPSSEFSSHRRSYNLSAESQILRHGPFDNSAMSGRLRQRAATAPDVPSMSMMSPYLHDGMGQLSSSLSTCENFSSINQINDVHRSFSSDRSLSQGHFRLMDGPDAWIHDADLSPSDPLHQWYHKTTRCSEWRDRVDCILRQIMSKDLRQQARTDEHAHERLRDAVKQVLDHLGLLRMELEQINLQEGLLQMPSEAFRNRTESLDCDAALGPPSCEFEHLPISQCIQEVLFRLLDLRQPHIQFRVAAICLHMSPTPNTALDMARMLYQLSKDSSNDALFAERGLISTVIQYLRQTSNSGTVRGASHDAAVLLMAVLKNATLDADNRFRVARADGPLVLSYLLRSAAVRPQGIGSTDTQDDAATTLAVQAIGVLRNMAASQELLPSLRKGETLKGLRGALALCGRDSDVAFGVARILCKLSLDDRTVMDAMAQPDLLRAFVRVAMAYVEQPAINLRFTYAFGNLVSQSTENAMSFTMVDGVVDYLEQSMQATIRLVEAEEEYAHSTKDESKQRPCVADSAAADEVASAVGFFAANICTTAEAALPIARRSDIAHASARLLMLCNKAAFYDASSHLAQFIRNITFYDRVSVLPDMDTPEAGGSAFLSLPPEVILRPIIPMMLSPKSETAAAAAGAVGNLMRITRAREYACTSCADEGLVLLLGSQNVSVVKAAAGALVNLAGDCAGCVKLTEFGVGTAVADALITSLVHAVADVDESITEDSVEASHGREMKPREVVMDVLIESEELLQLLCCLLKWHVGVDQSSKIQQSSLKAHQKGVKKHVAVSTAVGGADEGVSDCTAKEIAGGCHTVPSDINTLQIVDAVSQYDLGEGFWQEASALLHWMELIADMVDEGDEAGQVLHKAKEALASLMEEADDNESDAIQTQDGVDGKLSCGGPKQGNAAETAMFCQKSDIAVPSSSGCVA